MKLTSAFLCAFAEVRNGLLTAVSAGVTRVNQEYPLPLFVAGLLLEEDGESAPRAHELTIKVHDASTTRDLGQLVSAFQRQGERLQNPGEPEVIPFVFVLPVTYPLEINTFLPGHCYEVRVSVDGAISTDLSFFITQLSIQ